MAKRNTNDLEPEPGNDDAFNGDVDSTIGRVDGVTDSVDGSDGGNDGIVEQYNDVDNAATATNPTKPVDPAIGINTETRKSRGGSGGGGRQRAESGRTGRGKSTEKVDLNRAGEKVLAQQIVGVHKIIGMLSGMPAIWDISDDDGEKLCDAVLQVMAQYKIKPNPRLVAWANLIGVATVIYTPRVMATAFIIKTAKSSRAQSMQSQPINATEPSNEPGKMIFS